MLVIFPYLQLLTPTVKLLDFTERPLILLLRGLLVVPQVLWQVYKVLSRACILENFFDLSEDPPQLSDLQGVL